MVGNGTAASWQADVRQAHDDTFQGAVGVWSEHREQWMFQRMWDVCGVCFLCLKILIYSKEQLFPPSANIYAAAQHKTQRLFISLFYKGALKVERNYAGLPAWLDCFHSTGKFCAY